MSIKITGAIEIENFKPLEITIASNKVNVMDENGRQFVDVAVAIGDGGDFDLSEAMSELKKIIANYRKVSRLKLTERPAN